MSKKGFDFGDLDISGLKKGLEAASKLVSQKPVQIQPVYLPTYHDIFESINTEPILPEDYKSPGEYLEEIQQKQDQQIAALKEIIKKKDEEIEELKKQDKENKKLLKRQKIWNWATFLISTAIAIAGLVVAIVL